MGRVIRDSNGVISNSKADPVRQGVNIKANLVGGGDVENITYQGQISLVTKLTSLIILILGLNLTHLVVATRKL